MGSQTWAEFAQGTGQPHVVIDPRPYPAAIVASLPTWFSNSPRRGSTVFPTWQAALDFIASQPNITNGVLEVVGYVQVPTGTWNLRGMQVVGGYQGGAPATPRLTSTLAIVAGTLLQNVLGFSNLTFEVGAAAGPIVDFADASGTQSLTFNTCSVVLQANSTFVRVSGNNALNMSLIRTLVAKTGLGQELVEVTAAGSPGVLLQVEDSPSSVTANVFRCVANDQIRIVGDASAVVYAQPRTLQSATNAAISRLAPVPWAPPSVLVPEQLGGAAGRCYVRQATILVATGANFTVGNTVSLTDGTSTETWTCVAGAPGANQFQRGATLDESMDSLCSQVAANSTLWTTADFVASPLQPTGCVYMRRVQSNGAYADRIFATSSATLQVWDYSRGPGFGTYAYPGDLGFPTLRAVPTSDDGVPVFGWGENAVPGGFVVDIIDVNPNSGMFYRANRQIAPTVGTWTSDVAYTPFDAGVWAAPAPTNIYDAIDRIANVVGTTPFPAIPL